MKYLYCKINELVYFPSTCVYRGQGNSYFSDRLQPICKRFAQPFLLCGTRLGKQCWQLVQLRRMQVDNPAIIEALAALRSLQLFMHNGFNNIILESDCLLLVETRRGSLPCSSLFNTWKYNLDIRNLMHYFTSCIQYASRDLNRAAHKLARNAWHTDDIVLWMGEIPPFLEHSCWLDGSQL